LAVLTLFLWDVFATGGTGFPKGKQSLAGLKGELGLLLSVPKRLKSALSGCLALMEPVSLKRSGKMEARAGILCKKSAGDGL